MTTTPQGPSPADQLFGDFQPEYAATRRVLSGYPDGKGTWRPHEKSRPLSELATHVANIVASGTAILEQDELDVTKRAPLPTVDTAAELLERFESGLAKFESALAATTHEKLDAVWTMRRGNQVLLSAPRRVALRQLVMSHITHHRAQLGVYYRLLDVRVPGSYGPTADD